MEQPTDWFKLSAWAAWIALVLLGVRKVRDLYRRWDEYSKGLTVRGEDFYRWEAALQKIGDSQELMAVALEKFALNEALLAKQAQALGERMDNLESRLPQGHCEAPAN